MRKTTEKCLEERHSRQNDHFTLKVPESEISFLYLQKKLSSKLLECKELGDYSVR